MTNASELLPCPFCGWLPRGEESFAVDDEGTTWCVECPDCFARGPLGDETQKDAAWQWNTRQVTQLEAQLAEALGVLAKFQTHVIRHACVWDDAENGSHHHPIWAEVANLLTQNKEPK